MELAEFVQEFNANLMVCTPSKKLLEWHNNGILEFHFPELDICATVEQDHKFHKDTVFMHCVKTCNSVPADFILRWAGLLHDIGKAESRGYHIECGLYIPEHKIFEYCENTNELCTADCEHAIERITFCQHEIKSEKLAKKVLRSFGVKAPIRRKITHLVGMHMYNYTSEWTDAAVARFIRKSGILERDLKNPDKFPLFRLRMADRISRGLKPVTQRQRDFEYRLRNYFERHGV